MEEIKLGPNFTVSELQCPCCKELKMDQEFLYKLQTMRYKLGFPFLINSGYRCEKYNLSLPKSSELSQHLKGRAVDIDTTRLGGHKKFILIEAAIEVGMNGIGIYRNFLHIDNRVTQRVVWVS